MTEDTITIPNAAWWLNHSHVLIKEDMTAADQEWIGNRANRVVGQGTANAQVETRLGSAGILMIQRMVVEGVVAVQRSGGRVKTVHLPQEAEKLLAFDADYIVTKIGEYNAPMTTGEQADFLPSANGHVAASSNQVK